MMSAADQQRINSLFEIVRKSHADTEDGQTLLEVLEPHVNGAGSVAMDADRLIGLDEFKRELHAAVTELSPDQLREAKVKYWQLQSDRYARDAAMEYERRDALLSSKGNEAYANAFNARNRR